MVYYSMFSNIPLCGKNKLDDDSKKKHTHTHIYIYMYIYFFLAPSIIYKDITYIYIYGIDGKSVNP